MPSDALVMESSREWTSACDVQQRFMHRPVAGSNVLDTSARCRQVQQLGGDCYDFMPLADGCLAVTVGDASGKGLAAALMISNVQSSLRTAALLTDNDGVAAVRAVNRQVYASSLADRYATLFYGIFDGGTRTLRYVNAGHNLPMVVRRDGSIEWLKTGGAPVGMFADWSYEEAVVQLQAGDVVVAYTDGVVEAVNASGEEWGIEGLLQAGAGSQAESADDFVNAIFSAFDEFTGGDQSDDATVVVLRVR